MDFFSLKTSWICAESFQWEQAKRLCETHSRFSMPRLKGVIYVNSNEKTDKAAIEQWRKEFRTLQECREALSGAALSRAYHAQRPYFQNYVDSVVEKYGAERVNIVLGHTVRHYDYDGRFDCSVKDWAWKQPEAAQFPTVISHSGIPRDYHELVAYAHPVILNFVCKMQIKAEQEKEHSPKRKGRGEER